MKRMRNARSLLLAGIVSLVGCGELTSGGVGEGEVSFTADDSQAASASSVVPFGDGGREEPSRARQATLVEGELTLTAEAFLRSDASGEWVALTDGREDVTLSLDGQDEQSAGAAVLSEGSYDRFRVVFHEVEADVTGGLTIGGVAVLGLVRVDLGADGSLGVEREVEVEIAAGSRADLLVDMNAGTWLLAAQGTVLKTVAEAAVEAAVQVRVR